MTERMKKFFIIAGEVSGDQLGADLIQKLKKHYPKAQFFGIGGDLMIQAGQDILFHNKNIAVMGLGDVITRFFAIKRKIKTVIDHIRSGDYDAVICIDAQEFCKQIIKKIQDIPIKKILYVAPQVWVWRQKRAKKIAALYDIILTLFPFEPAYFTPHNPRCYAVGHPLYDQIERFKKEKTRPVEVGNSGAASDVSLVHKGKKNLLLLPGSRHHEIMRMLPIYLDVIAEVVKNNQDFASIWQVQLVYVNEVKPLIEEIIASHKKKHTCLEAVHINMTPSSDRFNAFRHADAALASSGTVTLELALFKVPMVVAYKFGLMTNMAAMIIKKYLAHSQYAALPNILWEHKRQDMMRAGRMPEAFDYIPEHLIFEANKDTILPSLENILWHEPFAINQQKLCAHVIDYFKENTHSNASAAVELTAGDKAAFYIAKHL